MLEIYLAFLDLCSPGPRVQDCQQWMETCFDSTRPDWQEDDQALEVCAEQIPEELWPR